MTTYAIATSSGQIRFLSEANAWVLAPDRGIRVFKSRAEATRFVAANAALPALKQCPPSVLTYLPNPRAGF